MKILSFLMRYSPGIVVVAIIIGVVSGLSNTILISLIHEALSGNGARPGAGLIGAFVAVCLLLPVTRVVSEVLLAKLAQRATFDLRMRLCRQIFSSPLLKLEEVGTHRLLATLTDDVLVITNTLISIPMFCLHCTIVIAGLLYLTWLAPLVALGVVLFLLCGTLCWNLALRRASRYLKMARDEYDRLFNHLVAVSEAVKEFKLYRHRREAFLKDVLEATSTTYVRHSVVGVAIYSGASSSAQLLFFTLLGLLLFFVPTVTAISTATLTGYILILIYLATPLDTLTHMLPSFSRATIAFKKVEELGLTLLSKEQESAASRAVVANPSWEQLELIGVTHSYHRERENSSFTLGPIDLTLRPGELIFIVGGNGSGKTTLAKLLTGLYTPESGLVRLNNRPVTERNLDDYRQFFTTIFADFYLFDSLLGLEKTELDERARAYLTKLQLDHKVEVKDGVLSTTELSQGQRKRLALLTAYLEDRPVYVFDEWAADQDPYFREIFYYQILPALKAKGKAVVVISHDDRYYHIGDRVLKLDYGKLEYDRANTPSPYERTEEPLPVASLQ